MVIWINSTISIHFTSLIPKMSIFTLFYISCHVMLDHVQFTLIQGPLIFQLLMQYCSLQHQTLLSPPDTSTTEHHFSFGPAYSLFLELFLLFSPVAYWAPINLGSSSFSVTSFCLFILFTGFSRQEYWSGLLFPSPVDKDHTLRTNVLHEYINLTVLDRKNKVNLFTF